MSVKDKFGLLKTITDAHSMGLFAAAALLKNCGYEAHIASKKEEAAVEAIESEDNQRKILNWISENNISHLGFSYRLDPHDAVSLFGKLVYVLKKNKYLDCENARLKSIYFAGLKEACDLIENEYQGRINTFRGGETVEETLLIMGIPIEEIPQSIINGCKYDKGLLKFGRKVIDSHEYVKLKPFTRKVYKEYGTKQDKLLFRLKNNFEDGFHPLIRAHSGPYSPDLSREECVNEYIEWCKKLAKDGFLDVLSIGSSQLSQSNFGEKWGNKVNGGGVPINSAEEYQKIWRAAQPMLVRTYSATKDVKKMAQLYESTINIAWHALSLWWFDELDGRGSNSLYKNLQEHIETLKYIATTSKPVEMNVPHHFAFRGCDDVTYIVSAYISAKMAKLAGNKFFILQNMLNTPRSTWGVQDLAKSRVLLKLIKGLEDPSFNVILQTRAGLDYFKPNIEEAKVQLAAVTAMMDDIDPYNECSPQIIHVVSYSEALFLASPDIINDSIKITRASLNEYRKIKRELGLIEKAQDEIINRENYLEANSRKIICELENNIDNLYTPEGLYIAFVAGWLPVPELWSDSPEFSMAKNWDTSIIDGAKYITENNVIMPTERLINKCVSNIPEAKRILKDKYSGRG